MKYHFKEKDKLIIFLSNYRFSKTDWERFEIKYFKKSYDVIIHDLLDLIHPDYHCGFQNIYKDKIIFKFKNLGEWLKVIFSLRKIYKSKNINVVTNLTYESFKEKLLLLILGILKFKVINFYLPGVAVKGFNTSQKGSYLTFLKNILKKQTLDLIINVLYRYLYSFICQKKLAILVNFRDLKRVQKRYPFSKVIQGSSFDYSSFLRIKNAKISTFEKQLPLKYAVHLDGAGPAFIGDEYIYNEKNPESIESWYGKLNKLFEHIENTLNLRFIIAAHPKTNAEKVSILYRNRSTFIGKTLPLVKNAQFVTTRQSTAISYAVIFSKPILFLTSNALLNWRHSNRAVKPILDNLNVTQFNLDNENYLENFSIPKVNNDIYLSYKKNWLSSAKLPNNKIIINFFDS